MMDRIVTIVGTALIFVAVTGPAMAGDLHVGRVPEPATMALFGLGVAGAYVAKRFLNRK
jgi:hypothetical protein